MSKVSSAALAGVLVLSCLVGLGCGSGDDLVPVPGVEGARKNPASARAERRAYDGAPPVVAHVDFGIECTECHNETGMDVPGTGFSPPSPHESTPGMGMGARCQQCHVFARSDDVFVASRFVGLRQDLRRGGRLHDLSPPVIPHQVFLRENCAACHTGAAAREEIRTTHPERTRCRQCHVEQRVTGVFPREE